ncbi:MAG: sigma-70 family RNA polymerase sigma factor [Pseudomonadota bacterium]
MWKAGRGQSLTNELPYLRRMARLVTGGNAADADDLVQETVLKAISRIDSFRGDAELRTWLTSIMMNVHRSDKRRASVRARYLEAQPKEEPMMPARQVDKLEVSETLDALKRLPEDQRMAIAAVAGGDLSYAQAAEVLGVKLGTFMSRISRGRAALRRLTEGSEDRPIEGDKP